MTTKLITPQMRTHIASQFVESVSESGNTAYYVCAARSTEFTNDDVPPTPNSSISGTQYEIFDELLFGKKVESTDIVQMTRRVDWVAGNTYDQYSETDPNLANANFIVVSQQGDDYYVFKCLSNNGNTAANDQPLFTETAADDEFYQTNDGFQWKYLWTISASQWAKFATSEFIPVIPDANVTANATAGAIETVTVSSGGTGFLTVNGSIKEAAVSGNSLLFSLQSANSTLSSNTDFYKNSVMYIRSGTGAGQAREISEYIVTGNERRALVNNSFTTLPDTTSLFEISPKIAIDGDGSGAVAIAVVNSSANSISTVEIVSRGSGYSYANATVSANTGANAIVVPVISPHGGHGSNVYSESFASRAEISVTFANTESNTIPVANDYRKIAVVRDPLFANVELTLTDSTASSFQDGEQIIHFQSLSANTLLRSFTYTLSRYQTVNTGVTTGFSANDDVSFEGKSGKVLSTNSTHVFVRLGVSSSAFEAADKIGDGTQTRTISVITAADPAVITTSNAHGFSNGTSVVFANVTGTAINDTGPTTYYLRTVNTTAFQLFTDASLSTTFDNSGNTAGSDGYVTNGDRLHTIADVAYTHTGNNDPISGLDDAGNQFAMVENGSALPLSMVTKENGTVRSSTSNTTSFTLTDITLVPNTDVIVAEIYTTVETILSSNVEAATTGVITNRSGNVLRLANVAGAFSTGTQVKGLTSEATATIAEVSKSTSIFNQLTEMTVQITSTGTIDGIGGTGFASDDYVVQDGGAEGYIHSMANTVTRNIANVTAANPAVVTTTAPHNFANAENIYFAGLNGTALDDDNSPTIYYLQTINSTAFSVFTDVALSSSFDNSANTAANTGIVVNGGDETNVNKTFFLNNVRGTFSVSDDVAGTTNIFTSNNGAVAKITGRIDPDLVDNTGEVIYVENFSPVTRANDQSEKIQLVIEF